MMLEILGNGSAGSWSIEPQHSQYSPLSEEVKNWEQWSFHSLCQWLVLEPTPESPATMITISVLTLTCTTHQRGVSHHDKLFNITVCREKNLELVLPHIDRLVFLVPTLFFLPPQGCQARALGTILETEPKDTLNIIHNVQRSDTYVQLFWYLTV